MGNHKPTVVGLAMSMPILAMTAVALRLEARRMKKSRLGADDYTIIISMLLCIGLCATILVAVFRGNLGGHIQMGPDGVPLESAEYVVFSKLMWIIQYLSVLGFGFTKISVLLLYRRIFVQKVFQITVLVVGAFVIIWTVGFFFANFFDCSSISSNWDSPTKGSSRCIDQYAMAVSLAVSDIITDAIILSLPWYPVWKLQMRLRRKLGVCAMFLLGGFVVAAGIVRFVFLLQSIRNITSKFDYTYTQAPAVYWTAVEGCIGVVSACLPTLRPIFSQHPPESIIGRIQNRVFTPSTHTKGSHGSVFIAPVSGADEASKSSLIRCGNRAGAYSCETTIGSEGALDSPEPSKNIRVQTDLSQRDEMV